VAAVAAVAAVKPRAALMAEQTPVAVAVLPEAEGPWLVAVPLAVGEPERPARPTRAAEPAAVVAVAAAAGTWPWRHSGAEAQ